MSGSIGSFSMALMAASALVAVSALSPAGAYDDVPGPTYDSPPATPPVAAYGYAPVQPGVRVYGYGPVYGEPAPPRRDREPLGTYAPSEGDNLSPSRGFFRGIERESGGN